VKSGQKRDESKHTHNTEDNINEKMADINHTMADMASDSTDSITLNTLASMMLQLMRQHRAEVASSQVRHQATQRQLSGISLTIECVLLL